MTPSSRESNFISAVTVQGGGGVGKEAFARYLAPKLGKNILPTGVLPRYVATVALRKNLFDKEDGRLVFGPRGWEEIADWLMSDKRRIRFKPVKHDPFMHLFVGRKDVMQDIVPLPTGVTSQGVLEPAATALVGNPGIVRQFIRVWREAIGGWGAVVVTRRNPDHFIPEAHKKFVLSARINEAAEYRLKRGVAANKNHGLEMKWLQARDNMEMASGLMSVPPDAVLINTTPFLLVRGGMEALAEREAQKMKYD